MKTFFIILSLLCLQISVSAQYDDKFYHPAKDWKDCRLPSPEVLYFYPGPDTLYSVLCKPTEKPLATLFYIHGNAGNISYNAPFIDILVHASFQVFVADFRGYGQSSGTPTHTNIADDGQLILDSLVKRSDIRSLPLVLYGASVGSQLAIKLAKDNPDKIAVLVTEGAMSSFADIALLNIPEEQREYVRPYLKFPYSAKEDIAMISGMPKLLLHSPDDRNIPFAFGQELYEKAREPKIFYSCKGAHNEALFAEPDSVIRIIKSLIHR